MSPEDRRKKVRLNGASQRLPGEVLGLTLNVVVAAFLFGFLGRWVGTKIGGQDYLTLLGGFIGAVAGFYSLYMHLTARSEDRETKSSG
ncbi:MAG: AtpZ/AtpI family protein [Gemmatimonadota bacterium]|nr:AtpZ/AtpI family protein [Gemmatimonadota bacterium]